jgi:hypothetical protein
LRGAMGDVLGALRSMLRFGLAAEADGRLIAVLHHWFLRFRSLFGTFRGRLESERTGGS